MSEIDTGSELVLARLEDGVFWVTLNRLERRNALNHAMFAALASALGRAEVDDDVRCVVLTGAGSAFSAGGDVKEMAATYEDRGEGTARQQTSYDGAVRRQRRNQRETSGRLYSMAKPTIAMIPGPAAGAGLSLALACDLRYASEDAIFTTAFAKVGFSGDYGGTWFLTKLVGSARARELYFFSERIDAREAERLSLVNAVFRADELEREVAERASRLASGPGIALSYMKENLNRAVNGELGGCLDMEATHHLHTGTTADHREAAAAFVEGRAPVFDNR